MATTDPDAEAELKRKRERDMMYKRRKRARKRIEIEVLKEQRAKMTNRNNGLKADNDRLERLLRRARDEIDLYERLHNIARMTD